MISLFFFSFFACQNTTNSPTQQAPLHPPAQEENISTPKNITEKKETPTPMEELPFTSNPKQYSDTWLVILQSSKEIDSLPTTWPAIQQREDFEPARLKSGLYKNLMPCWNILVAAGFSTKEDAVELSKDLKASGIDNYVKNAGKFIGEDPRIEKLCNSTQERIDSSPYRLGISANGHIQMRLKVSDVLLERMVQAHYKQLTSLSDSVWHTKLPVQNIDGYQQGDAYTAINLTAVAPPTNCSIQNFSMMVLGVPHFSEENIHEPKCGSPEIFAELDCTDTTLETPYLLIASSQTLPEIVLLGEATETTEFARDTQLDKIHQDAQEEAKRQESPLQTKTTTAPLHTLDGKTKGSVQTVQYLTNEGNNYCGGVDVNMSYSAIFQDKKQISPLIESTEQPILAIINPYGEKPLFIREEWPITWRIVDTKEREHYVLEKGFCDCGC